jgi:prolyl-tRNA synthetase
VPVRIEIGPKDVDADQVVVAQRVSGAKETRSTADAIASMASLLDHAQRALYEDARAYRDAHTHEITSYESFVEGVEAEGGFWAGGWCGDRACEDRATDDSKATIRLLPLERQDPGAPCAVCGKPGTERATWARAY